jgi:hypothetical protein
MFRSFIVLSVVIFSFVFCNQREERGRTPQRDLMNRLKLFDKINDDYLIDKRNELRSFMVLELSKQDWFKDCDLNNCTMDTIVNYTSVLKDIDKKKRHNMTDISGGMREFEYVFGPDNLDIKIINGVVSILIWESGLKSGDCNNKKYERHENLRQMSRPFMLLRLSKQDWLNDCDLNNCTMDTIVDYTSVLKYLKKDKKRNSREESINFDLHEYHSVFGLDNLEIKMDNGVVSSLKWETKSDCFNKSTNPQTKTK